VYKIDIPRGKSVLIKIEKNNLVACIVRTLICYIHFFFHEMLFVLAAFKLMASVQLSSENYFRWVRVIVTFLEYTK